METSIINALEELSAPVKSDPMAWVYTNNCGTYYTDDKREWYDAVGIEEVTPLYSESTVRQLEQQVEMLRDVVKHVIDEVKLTSSQYELCRGVMAATEGEK